jgi:hypothetical protein
MECKEADCRGTIQEGVCDACGKAASPPEKPDEGGEIVASSAGEPEAFTEDLLHRSQKLEALVPDDYQAWRMQADLFLSAIRRLETREIEPDESIKLMHVPLRESALRDAAEEALRNCAHFAQTFDERVILIDEANRIRRTTWL